MRRVGFVALAVALAGLALFFTLNLSIASTQNEPPPAVTPEIIPLNPLLDRPDPQQRQLIPYDGKPADPAPELQPAPLPSLNQPLSLDGDIQMTITLDTEFTCDPAGPSTITVTLGSQLIYCYVWTNATTTTFEFHDLVDSEFGTLFDYFPYPLLPGETVAWFLPSLATTDTVNTALWTAYDPVTPLTQTAVAGATVIVSGTLPPVADFGPPYLISSQPTDTQRDQYIFARNRGGANLTWNQVDCNTDPWLSLPVPSGVIPPFSSRYITTTFDSSGLGSGSYTTTLCFNTNDPLQPQIVITGYLRIIDGNFIFDATVGTDPQACAATDVITVVPGSAITYCYTVYNGLSTTLEFHQFESENYGFWNFFPYTLHPGETLQFLLHETANITVTDHVTWTSASLDGTLTVSDSDVTTVNNQGDPIPRLQLYPEAVSVSLLPDAQLTRDLLLENIGAADLDWTLADCSGTLPGWLAVAPDSGLLAPGDSTQLGVTFDTTGLITDTTYTTDLCLDSNDPVNSQVVVPVTLDVVSGFGDGLVFTKTVGLVADECATTDIIDVSTPTTVTYCYQVENQSEEFFLLHDVVDSELGPLLEQFPLTLAPEGRVIFVLNDVVITQTTTSTTTWTAYDANNTAYVAQGTTTVNVTPPEQANIALQMTVGLGPGCAASDTLDVAIPPEGLVVTYCYQVTNHSPYALNWHNVEDSLHGRILVDTWHHLPAGATFAFTQTTVITSPTANHAVWEAYNPAGPSAWAESTAVVETNSHSIFLPLMAAGRE